jgi:fibronectin-binding autotransporter adhesin
MTMTAHRAFPRTGAIVAAGLTSILVGHTAGAATYTWSNAAQVWSSAASWGGTVPTGSDVGLFNSNSSYAHPATLTASATIGGVWDTGSAAPSIGSAAGADTLTINGATINGNPSTGIEMDPGAGALSIGSTLSLGGPQTWLNNSSAGALSIGGGSAGGINLNGYLLTVSGSGNQTYGGSIKGTGGLTLTGGFLVLTSSSTASDNGFPAPITTSSFSGNIIVNGGTLEAAAISLTPGNNGVFGQCSNSRTITVNSGGTIEFLVPDVFGQFQATTVPTLLINGGLVTNMAPPGATGTNSVVNNPLNNITLSGGTLSATTGEYNGMGGYGSWDINGSVTSTGNSLISSSDPVYGNVMLTAAGQNNLSTTFNVQNGTLTISAIVVDDYRNGGHSTGLNLTGSGLLLLTNSDGYSGGTTVGGGTLQLGNGAAGNDGALTATSGVTDNATLVYNLYGSQTASYAISGNGSLTKTGQGLLNLAVANSYGAGTTVNSGTLQVGAAGAIPSGPGAGDVTVSGPPSGSGVLDLAGNLTNINGLWGGGTVDDSVGGGTLAVGNNGDASTFSGIIQNSNTAAGFVSLEIVGGTLTLTGANTYLGGTTVSSGNLIVTNSEAIEDGTDLYVGTELPLFGGIVPAQSAAPAADPLRGYPSGIAPVPEPCSLALLATAVLFPLLRRSPALINRE